MLMNTSERAKSVQWKRLLTFGNECFEKQNLLQAEYYYKEAESQLDYLWTADPENVQLLMAWICALHNLSTLFELQGNKQIGLEYLLIPHNRMLNLSHSEETSDDLKLIAIKALKITFKPILTFTQKHPICGGCEQVIKEFQNHINSSKEVIH